MTSVSVTSSGISVSVPQGAQGPQGDQGPGGPVGGLTYATVAALEAATVPATNTLAYVRGYAEQRRRAGLLSVRLGQ